MKNKHSSWKVRTDEFGLPVANLTPVSHRTPIAKKVKFSLPLTNGTPPPLAPSSESSPRESQQADLLSNEPPLISSVETGRPSLDLPSLDVQDITKFQCKKCPFVGPSENVLEAHVYDVHSPVFSSSHETIGCSASPHAGANCDNHVSPTVPETSVSVRPQKCPLCSATCSNSVDLLTHTCGAAGGEPDPPEDSPNRNCPVCGFVVRAADKKVDSILRRHVYNKHSCQKCKFIEKMNGELKNHMRHCRGRLPSSGTIPKTSTGSQDNNTSNSMPPSKQSVVLLAKNPPQTGSRQPSHECENCGLKFTFKAHFELHRKSCLVASKRTFSSSDGSTQLPLNKCQTCSFVGKNLEALNLHMTVAHSSVKSGLLPSQHPIRSDFSSIIPPPAGRCVFDISFTNSQTGAIRDTPDSPPRSQPVSNNSILNDTPVSQESDLPSSRSQVRGDPPPSSIPNETCRIGNAINILFPISGFLPCTEASCGFKSFGSSYNICKRSLKRHLETHHKLQIRACHFWCYLCQSRITRHPAAHGCFKNSPLLIPPDRPFEWKCDACDLSFPTEIGLKNHALAHKLRNIKNSGAPLTLVKPKSIPRRARFAPVVPETGDEFLPVPGAPTNSDRLDILTPPATNSEEDSSMLKPYITEISALLEVEATEGSFNYFCNIVDQAVAEIQSSVLNGPPRDFASSSPAPPVNTKDPKSIQILFKKNPRKAVRAITKTDGERCKIPISSLEDHFSNVWGPSSFSPDFYRQCEDNIVPLLDTPFTVKEVKVKLQNAANTSPGPDRITYADWKTIPASVKFLVTVFNACVHFQRIPPSWKTSTTVLLPKSGDPNLPNNWRPIALSSTMYKMFTKCLAARLSAWCERYDVLSKCQKGFTPHDGVIEHNYVLKNFLDSARKDKTDACIAWLDVTNAFGSIPHEAIFEMLSRSGAGLSFTELIRDIYSNSFTKILSDGGLTRDIPVLSGSVALHVSGLTPVGVRNSPFIDNAQIKNIEEGYFHKFLGKPVGFNPCPDYQYLSDIAIIATRLLESCLAPWQRIAALKTFFFPALQFPMRNAQFDKEKWAEIDAMIRPEIKNTLGLPERACNDYLYASRKVGAVGLPIAAEDADLHRIDTAFKLLTSNDSHVAELALAELVKTVKFRLRKPSPSDNDLGEFMTGEARAAQFDNSNLWTCARRASARQGIRWEFVDNAPRLLFGDLILKSANRKNSCSRLETDFDSFVVILSWHVLIKARFSEWRFVHKARTNTLPLNGNKPWDKTSNTACRGCDECDLETLAHVLNHCKGRSRGWQLRHNSISDRIKNALLFDGCTLISENQPIGPDGQRPDLVFRKRNEVYIIDITCPFENRLEAFTAARNHKIEKYASLVPFFESMGLKATIIPILVGALGSWDPKNDTFLRKHMAKSFLHKLQRLCASETIRWSCNIYVEHVTGVRQFSVNSPPIETITPPVPDTNYELIGASQ
ncbi:Retrovirus-related Pol polyprotein from type-1 retrotransposable element R2 [Araneus ventricosus]|uniref:Retrovirus-related Pol polyprotein from type-1 retrotransposable element R2 n=1 Tax=Araneus ventricosus TaxID=182803 RepID=A0A4Y2KIM7_ARAVE|nr:Retrovirus-related Pol polyprotein from type-1 retrotransposable element R2 [Araneus ventricosus]